MNENFLDNKNSYIAFDGTSIRDIIVNRLNQGQVFTDQNYQGSNLSALIDIISYTFSTLLYYLNKTSSESMFSESQLYENMNRIVKLINYRPIGRLGQNLPFVLTASSNILKGNYYIPRYSYITVGGVNFSFNTDIVFSKTLSESELVLDNNNLYLLYQGVFNEYPLYTASGIDNEVVYMALDSNVKIDHFNIFVYVKPKNSSTWKQWTNVTDFILYDSNEFVYTTRFNDNLRYEIQFGDGVNGKKLNEGDEVAIYYLRIDSEAGGVSPNATLGSPITLFNSNQYVNIQRDVSPRLNSKIELNQLSYLTINNNYPSNSYLDYENVDKIRENAPKSFKSQNRLITINDFESFVKSRYPNLHADVQVKSNDDYLKGHIKYLYNIGLNSPQHDNQILYNQIKFSSSCNFNNIYVYILPNNENQMFLEPSQKELIYNGLEEAKPITSNIVIMDPVYMSFDFYLKHRLNPASVDDVPNSKLRVVKSQHTRRSSSAILSDIINVFSKKFNKTQIKLADMLDLYQLTSEILAVEGVDTINTYRTDDGTTTNGLSILIWNTLYPNQDKTVYAQNVKFDYFQYFMFNNLSNLVSRIEIVDRVGNAKLIEV